MISASIPSPVPESGHFRRALPGHFWQAPKGSSRCVFDGCGVVFKLDPAGQQTVLYSFTGGADGGNPLAGVIRDSAGNLYGTTSSGGAQGMFGNGVVYKLNLTTCQALANQSS